MTAFDLLLLVTGFVALLTGAAWVWERINGPDPEVWDPRSQPMCRCGVRGGAARHVHASWTERKPR